MMLPTPTLELLVLQPTPLCNLDCTYCYLPNRKSTARMPMEVVEAAVRSAVESPFLGPQLTIVWHAGEPMVIAPGWYEEAFARIERIVASRTRVTHSFQTNGTRLHDGWSGLLARPDVRIGVSYDGPAFLHDAHRVRLDGSGTHASVRQGMELLNRAGIPFHVISVVTRATLAHPESFLDDVISTGAFEIGLNFEEQEGVHASSSLGEASVEEEVRRFFARLLEHARKRSRDGCGAPRIREVDSLSALLLQPRPGGVAARGTQENEGFRIVSVAHDGACSTWSPELLEQRGADGGNFILGNVLNDSLENLWRGEAFRIRQREIDRGRDACARDCAFYEVCGGGSPSNKLSELQRLDGTRTRHCRVTRQVLAEVVLSALESDFGLHEEPDRL